MIAPLPLLLCAFLNRQAYCIPRNLLDKPFIRSLTHVLRSKPSQ
jgi:hypothetical protein